MKILQSYASMHNYNIESKHMTCFELKFYCYLPIYIKKSGLKEYELDLDDIFTQLYDLDAGFHPQGQVERKRSVSVKSKFLVAFFCVVTLLFLILLWV